MLHRNTCNLFTVCKEMRSDMFKIMASTSRKLKI